jgi:hypothetical protein
MSKILISKEKVEKLGIKDYSVLYRGKGISTSFFELITGIDKEELKEVLVDENDLDNAIDRALDNKISQVKRGLGQNIKYKRNITEKTLDDTILQNPVVGRLITDRIYGDESKEVFLVDVMMKRMNDIIVNCTEYEVLNMISSVRISTVNEKVPNIEINRFDVTNKSNTLVEKEVFKTSLGNIKVNNPNYGAKVMLVNSKSTERVALELINIIRDEISQLSFEIQKQNFEDTPEEVKNSETYRNQIGMIYLSDYTRASIERKVPREKDYEDRSALHELFYNQLGTGFINNMKITFTSNLTKVLTSEIRSDMYDHVKKDDGYYYHRDFLCKESFSIPFNVKLLDQFIERIYDLQSVINICSNLLLFSNIGIDIDHKTVLEKYLHAGDHIDFDKINLLNNDIDKIEKIKRDIDRRVDLAFSQLNKTNFMDLIDEGYFKEVVTE